ncbi:ankyrin repeat domain-containing protein 33B [Denticeps clupeoides]|uniref:Ankyrin repeat domain 33Bb n=1 Tax=Denticeps clupeoides TaxID=299321 RepID=A0AAY4A712_9TELE|nr:ankyrin repeat domain-containing protein 33B-like [Denticeps clupeoides]
MVLITEDGAAGGPPSLKIHQNGDVERGDESDEDYSGDGDEDEDDDDDDVYQDFEELQFSDLHDCRSIASDDSFYPPDESLRYARCVVTSPSPEPLTLFRACCTNNSIAVKLLIRQGVAEEEVREADRNNRSGLIVACYNGYVDVVMALSRCPYLDVNWQDNEGNTALIMAAQAGHLMISQYLLNYFPGLDIERRNCHGFTAVMKAAMQGRAECVRVLMMSGADVEATDYGRKLTSHQWALFTGRYETARMMARLMAQPCAEQFCDSFRMEWPQLEELVARAREPKSCWQRFVGHVSSWCLFNFRTKLNPQEGGVLDHMVKMTTAIGSPMVAPVCRTVCPGSPPCLGKRRPAVQDIVRQQRAKELRRLATSPERLDTYKRLFQNSRVLLVPKKTERRASLQPQMLRDIAGASSQALRRTSLLPLHMLRRSSVRPGIVVPKVRLCKAPPPSFIPERSHRRTRDAQNLEIPVWKYKELKEVRKAENNMARLHLVRRK